jgi:hypothetical protein
MLEFVEKEKRIKQVNDMTWKDEIRKVREQRQGDSPSPDNAVKVFGEKRPHFTLEGEYKADANKLYAEFEKAVDDIYKKYNAPNWFNQELLKNGLEDVAEAILLGIKQREPDFDKSKTGE